MKNVLLVILSMCVMFLQGCASFDTSYQYQFKDLNTKEFNVIDNRPRSERTSGSESSMITNCNYGSRRIGDDLQNPKPVKVLRNELSENLGDEFKAKEFVLHHFTLHYNRALQLRNQVSVGKSGLIPDLMLKNKPVGCSESDFIGGYSLDEVNGEKAPIIVVIEMSVDGEKYLVRNVYEPPEEAPKWLEFVSTKEWGDFVKESLMLTISELVEKIKFNK